MKTLRVAICVVLIVGVLAMSLSVFAVDEPEPTPTVPPILNPENPVTLQLEMASMFVWKMLDAWGIRVAPSTWLDTTDDVLAWVEQMMVDYAIDTGITVAQLIAPWLFNEDIWGNLMANDRAVSDIEDFAQWLIAKFNLQDNGNHVVASQIVIPAENQAGIDVYIPAYYVQQPLGNWYPYIPGNTDFFSIYRGFEVNEIYELLSGYYARWYDNGSSIYLQISNTSEFVNNVVSEMWVSGDNYTKFKTAYRLTAGYNGSNKIPLFYVADYQTNYPYKFIVTAVYDRDNNRTSASFSINRDSNFINTYFMPQNMSIQVQTAVIVLPDDDPEYTEGDGIIITPDGNLYQHVIIENPINVANLPAIISQRNIPDIGYDDENPGFSVPWQAINGLIQYVAAPAGAIMALVNEAPIEGVIMLYALIGGIIIFGMIRIMREH